MKFKPSSKGGGVLVELSPKETQLPGNGKAGESIALFRLKKILVPMDFSDCSKKALQYALPLAKQFGSEIILVHVMPYAVQPPETILADTHSIDASGKVLNDLLREISSTVTARASLRVGSPHAEIVEAAKESEADLIVLSTHGHSGLAHMLLGSTAERVVRHAPCPVLVVREKEHEFILDRLNSVASDI